MNIPDPSDTPKVIAMAPAEPLDEFWLSTIQDTAKGSVAALEDAAKQLVGITSFSQTLYFAAISFGDLKKGVMLTPAGMHVPYILCFLCPLGLWAASLWFAVKVFKPARYPVNLESPDDAREAYNHMVDFKHNALRSSHIYLTIGFVMLLLDIFLYLLAIPVAPSK